jgi:hypothetical protein
LKASGELMSGFVAPLRTNTPTPTFAMMMRSPGMTLPCARYDLALRLKSVEHWHRANDDIGAFTLLNTVRDSTCGSVGDDYFVSRGLFKIRYQCVNDRVQSRGAKDLDFSRSCRSLGSDAKQDKPQNDRR